MSEFQKVATLNDLKNLDDDEILKGYRSGLNKEPEPGSDKSRSFWHGWRNGMIDRGVFPSDSESSQLAQEYVRRVRAH